MESKPRRRIDTIIESLQTRLSPKTTLFLSQHPDERLPEWSGPEQVGVLVWAKAIGRRTPKGTLRLEHVIFDPRLGEPSDELIAKLGIDETQVSFSQPGEVETTPFPTKKQCSPFLKGKSNPPHPPFP